MLTCKPFNLMKMLIVFIYCIYHISDDKIISSNRIIIEIIIKNVQKYDFS